jgi:hypothetical protein
MEMDAGAQEVIEAGLYKLNPVDP